MNLLGAIEILSRQNEVTWAQILAEASGGTYVNIEGPAFSTRAESETYRKLGFDVVGMTSLPEAKLSREAGLCFAPVALVTDYDCWHPGGDVDVPLVMENVAANAAVAARLLVATASALREGGSCRCASSLEGAVMTHQDRIPQETKDRLRFLFS